MLKKEVNFILSEIVKSNNVKHKLDIQHEKFLFDLFENTSLCYLNKETHNLYVDFYKINRRYVRMLFARRKCDNTNIPLSKKKIMLAVFPPKKIESKDEKHLRDFKQAARELITEQIVEYRHSVSLPVTCPISKKLLTNWSMIHIDHVYPFSLLLDNWLEKTNLRPQDIKLKGSANNKTFADVSLCDSWQNYHREFGLLQCLSKIENLKKSNNL